MIRHDGKDVSSKDVPGGRRGGGPQCAALPWAGIDRHLYKATQKESSIMSAPKRSRRWTALSEGVRLAGKRSEPRSKVVPHNEE